jgi:AraC-like DNA-binding protein
MNENHEAPVSDTAQHQRMIALLSELAKNEGYTQSRLPGVHFMYATEYIPPTQITYDPSIVVILQGRKIGRIGDHQVIYDPDYYLVLCVPLPFECETLGTREEPLLGVSVHVESSMVAELLMGLDTAPQPRQAVLPVAMDSTPLGDTLRGTVLRLLESLTNETDAKILGPSIVRELVYRVLEGPLGYNLRTLALPHSHQGRIGKILNRIHMNYADEFDVNALAGEAGMGVSTFHAHFKSIAHTSPIQYIKSIRLHKARVKMANEALTAAEAAMEVGYESTSQFSREYKRFFGVTPAADANMLRERYIQLL